MTLYKTSVRVMPKSEPSHDKKVVAAGLGLLLQPGAVVKTAFGVRFSSLGGGEKVGKSKF
jgi:hypothetical protein